jgi:hypothetical protein
MMPPSGRAAIAWIARSMSVLLRTPVIANSTAKVDAAGVIAAR